MTSPLDILNAVAKRLVRCTPNIAKYDVRSTTQKKISALRDGEYFLTVGTAICWHRDESYFLMGLYDKAEILDNEDDLVEYLQLAIDHFATTTFPTSFSLDYLGKLVKEGKVKSGQCFTFGSFGKYISVQGRDPKDLALQIRLPDLSRIFIIKSKEHYDVIASACDPQNGGSRRSMVFNTLSGVKRFLLKRCSEGDVSKTEEDEKISPKEGDDSSQMKFNRLISLLQKLRPIERIHFVDDGSSRFSCPERFLDVFTCFSNLFIEMKKDVRVYIDIANNNSDVKFTYTSFDDSRTFSLNFFMDMESFKVFFENFEKGTLKLILTTKTIRGFEKKEIVID